MQVTNRSFSGHELSGLEVRLSNPEADAVYDSVLKSEYSDHSAQSEGFDAADVPGFPLIGVIDTYRAEGTSKELILKEIDAFEVGRVLLTGLLNVYLICGSQAMPTHLRAGAADYVSTSAEAALV